MAALTALLTPESMALLEIEFQGDPRGPSIIVHEKGGLKRLASFW